MAFNGVIIEESLTDKSVLNDVVITSTKVESVTEHHKTPWVKQWTLHTVEIPEDKAADVADKKWYDEATEYGTSIGIPEYQVDFSPHLKLWGR